MRGKLITLEGIEGAGKTTVLQFIQNYGLAKQWPLRVTREPGGTVSAEKIRQLLLHDGSAEPLTPLTELLLMFAARQQHITQVIAPALAAGEWVLSDRYIDASYAYQGGGRQLPMASIQALDSMVVGAYQPDLTLLLDVPVAVGLARTVQRGAQQDRIEQEKSDFFQRVREVYLQRAHAAPDRIKCIDASQPLAQVTAQIQQLLDQFCAASNGGRVSS